MSDNVTSAADPRVTRLRDHLNRPEGPLDSAIVSFGKIGPPRMVDLAEEVAEEVVAAVDRGLLARDVPSRPAPAQDVTARAAREIVNLLPLGADGTGHIVDCGYTEDNLACGCSSLLGRIRDVLAGLLARDLPSLDDVLGVLAENGLPRVGGFHGWRCDYPERYGPCECVADLAADLLALLRGESDG